MVVVAAMSALIVAGLLALALAMRRHHAQVFGPRPLGAAWRMGMRLLGWILLAAAGAVVASSGEPGIGAMSYLGILTLAAGSIALVLAYLPGR